MMKSRDLESLAEGLSPTERMPVLFVGHGSPMNAIEDNEFSRRWRGLAGEVPRPAAILCISAHWETRGAQVTAMEAPPTIHDFGGFPRELYEAEYPAPGSPWLAEETRKTVRKAAVGMSADWGLDHGCWSVLKQMYPAADVPVIQLSLDRTQPAPFHLELGRELAPLRERGVLIVGSGNLVHNLGRIRFKDGGPADFNAPFGLDWALEANALFKTLIEEERYDELAAYRTLGSAVQLAVPTPDHYLPMLYAAALRRAGEPLAWFNDVPLAGSLTMTSFRIG